MLDLFKVAGDVPGLRDCDSEEPLQRVRCIEQALAEDMGDHRFVPHLQLHEFEALVLCDLDALVGSYPNRRKEIQTLKERLAQFPTPEHVNRMRPPSYWLKDLIPEYDKPTAGVSTVADIGLPKLRERCPHFDEWIGALEAKLWQE
jgi:hypothetical protein